MSIDARRYVDVLAAGTPPGTQAETDLAAATVAGAIAGDEAGRVAGAAAGAQAGTEVASEAGAAAGAAAGEIAGAQAGTGSGATAGAAAGATAGGPAGAAAATALLNGRSITGGGLAAGGGTLAADRVITVTAASQAEAEAGAATTVVMTPQRATDHFNDRVTAFMRTVTAAADEAAALLLLGVTSAVTFATAAGAGLVGTIQAGTGAILRTVLDKLNDRLDVRDFGVVGAGNEGAKIQAAINRAIASGRELVWPAGAYSFDVALACAGVRMRFMGPVTLTYSGAAHIATGLDIGMGGVETALLGRLTIDGNNKVNTGLKIVNSSATAAQLTLGDVRVINCKMVVAGPTGGAGGIVIRGNVDVLQADFLSAENIDREPGTGSLGNNGTIGVEISRIGGYAPRVIRIGTARAKNITTQDVPGSPACFDVDGVQIFQNDEDDAALSVDQVVIVNAQGRGLKAQAYRACRVGQISIHRSIAGITDGSSDVAYQLGEGVAPQIAITYTGLAATVHGQGTTPVSAYTGTARADGFGVVSFENVTIKDETTGGGTERIYSLFNINNAAGGTNKLLASLRNVLLIGRAARSLVDVGNNGGTGRGPATVIIDGFTGELTEALIATDSTKTADFLAIVSGVRQTGADVPAMRQYAGSSLGNSFGRLIDADGNMGIKKQTTFGEAPGLACVQRGMVGYANQSNIFGFNILINQSLAAGATVESELFGLNQTHAIFWAGSSDFGPGGMYTTDGDVIATTTAGVGVVVSSTGAEPASGSIRIWKSDTGKRFSVKNADASSRYVFLVGLG